MNYRRAGMITAIVVALAGTAGCSSEPKLVPVTGTVKVNGKPTGQVRVYFVPKDASVHKNFTSRMANGQTDASGKFELTGAHGKGLATGEYKVTFSYTVTKAGKVIGPNQKPDEMGAKEALGPEFTEPGKTQTFATVTETQNDFLFEISFK